MSVTAELERRNVELAHVDELEIGDLVVRADPNGWTVHTVGVVVVPVVHPPYAGAVELTIDTLEGDNYRRRTLTLDEGELVIRARKENP